MLSKDDLTTEEWEWLIKLHRHETAFLTTAMADRLLELGAAERKLGGVGISSDGKGLLLHETRKGRGSGL